MPGHKGSVLFKITLRDKSCQARCTELKLSHGTVKTPAFIPVGTNGSVKAVRFEDLQKLKINLILANTYHLYLRPGLDVIQNAGGLHSFMGWKHNILTDSGGFQVFSLSLFRKIEEEGIVFKSHLDGSTHRLTPKKVMEIQNLLGSDILMPLDVCTETAIPFHQAKEAVRLTTLWAKQSKEAGVHSRGSIFAIVQGNFFKDLRKQSALELIDLDFPGYAIGGLSVGEDFETFKDTLSFTSQVLPEDKPKYLMGVGTPAYILTAIENGIDLFDCVYPTRIARNAMAFTKKGHLSLKTEKMKYDLLPIDPECDCFVCRKHSRSYLRHLFKAKEIQAAVLTTYHNIYFIHRLIEQSREAIANNTFTSFKESFLSGFKFRI